MLILSDWQLQADCPVQIGDSWEGEYLDMLLFQLQNPYWTEYPFRMKWPVGSYQIDQIYRPVCTLGFRKVIAVTFLNPNVSNQCMTAWIQPYLQTVFIWLMLWLLWSHEQLRHTLLEILHGCWTHPILITQEKLTLGTHHLDPQITLFILLIVSLQDPRKPLLGVSQRGRNWVKIMRSSQGLYYLICLRLSWDSWIKCKPLFIIHELLSLSQREMWTILYFILRGWSLSTLSIMSGKNGIMNYVYNEV